MINMVTTSSEVLIQPLEMNGRVVLPQFYLGTNIGNWDEPAIEVYKIAPTLDELRHG